MKVKHNYTKEYSKKYRASDIIERPVYTNELTRITNSLNIDKALDIGCGTGRYFSYVKCNELTGVDFSKEMLDEAKNHLLIDKKQYNKLILKQDLVNNFIKNEIDSKYDFIYSIGLLGFPQLKDMYASTTVNLFKGIYRILKNGGLFFASISNRGFELGQIEKLLDVGFSDTKIKLTELNFTDCNEKPEFFVHCIK